MRKFLTVAVASLLCVATALALPPAQRAAVLSGGQPNPILFRYSAGDSTAGATFSRTSTATYTDASGVIQTAASGVLRDGHYVGGVRTTLLEGSRTNHFLNSATPANQTSPSLTTGSYTLWLDGTGSVAVAAGTATISGAGTATSSAPVTFTVSAAGTVAYTVTGTPARVQSENGPFRSSYIPTTSATVTRAADSLSFPFTHPPQEMSVYFRAIEQGPHSGNPYHWRISTSTPRFGVYTGGFNQYRANHHNGVTAVEAVATASSTPTSGTKVESLAVFSADGAVQSHVSVDDGAITSSGVTAALTPASSWGNATISLGAGTFAAYRNIEIYKGTRDMSYARSKVTP